LGRSRNDPAGESREGEGLQPDLTWSAQGGEKQALTPKKRGFYAADELDVVADARLESDDTSSIHAENFAGIEGSFIKSAPGVDESPAVAGEALHDEAFAAKKPGPELVRGSCWPASLGQSKGVV